MKKFAIMMMALAVGCVACSHDDNPRDGNGGNNDDVITCRDSNAQSYDIYGKCEGSIAKYCDDKSGRYVEENCAKNTDGKNTCGKFELDGEYYFGCIEGNGGPGGNGGKPDDNHEGSCMGDDGKQYNIYGACSGSIARYCDNDGNFVKEDCSQNTDGRTTCGEFVDPTGKFYGCISPGGAANDCGSVTSNGVCVGNSLRYCASGSLVTESCPYKCAYTDQDYAACYERCGDVDSKGKCDGTSKVAYCGFAYNSPGHQDGDEVDVLVVLECKKGESCGEKINGEYDCLENSSN
ncbi:MAG: hypothetical protein IIY06_01065 [Proteobacteria bacterium]|nr:hypothetical protein [Pseudomonadota bacterium]